LGLRKPSDWIFLPLFEHSQPIHDISVIYFATVEEPLIDVKEPEMMNPLV